MKSLRNQKVITTLYKLLLFIFNTYSYILVSNCEDCNRAKLNMLEMHIELSEIDELNHTLKEDNELK